MSVLDYAIVAIYLLMLLAIGIRFRYQKSKQDYFLGGRQLGWQALTLSVMATQLSAVSFISAPAFVGLREGGGLIWLSYELALPLAMLLLLWKLLPTLHKSGFVSVYDFLEQRFGLATRLLISVVFQVSRSFATAIMIYAISIILQGTMGLSLWFSISAIGAITLIYSTFGGMKAVVYGDAVQMILILLGAALCLFTALDAIGGWSVFVNNVDTARLNATNLQGLGLNGNDFGLLPMLFGGIVLYASYYGCDQSEAQRSLSSSSLQDLRKILVSVGLLRFPITALYCLTGLVIGTLFYQAPHLLSMVPEGRADWMMPIFITEYLPAGLVGLMIVAIMAAAMSSLSSAVNSLAAVSTEDFFRFNNTSSPDNTRYMKTARVAAVLWGIVTLVIAGNAGDIAPTIIEAINKIGSVFYGPILATFLLGVHTQRINGKAVNIGLTLGVLTNVSLWLTDSSLFWFWWNVTGFAITMVAAIVIATWTKQPASFPQEPSIQENTAHVTDSVTGIKKVHVVVLTTWTFLIFTVCILTQLL